MYLKISVSPKIIFFLRFCATELHSLDWVLIYMGEERYYDLPPFSNKQIMLFTGCCEEHHTSYCFYKCNYISGMCTRDIEDCIWMQQNTIKLFNVRSIPLLYYSTYHLVLDVITHNQYGCKSMYRISE